ncbi:DNA-binding transcriptional regulator, MarR family [Paenibacillus algorifonticola]|uniref:DNA-binding transcriptional regulator, MarR family n=2 Tax=Paenibacillus algorifonticola TaxID=684063 RepID=A0A1I2AM81_9BACL|nr:DNA-binding transcriptional regulator, MarR family [Paenibacillus algorifonticola]
MYNRIMLKHNVLSLVAKIRDKANKRIVSELEANQITGIVPSHGDILMFLYREKQPLTVKALAEKIHRTQPTTTVLINKLEQLGYVERTKDEKDSRVSLITLTERGRELEPIFLAISQQINDVIYGSLSEEQSLQLEQLLEQVHAQF